MKTAMKLTTGILIAAITMAGAATTKAVAQSPDAIDNARSTAKALQQNDAAAATPSAKPVAGAPASAIKPALIPGSSAAAKPAAKSASAASANNQLKHVNVLQGADSVQIEINSSRSVTPKVTKLSSPTRVLVELPETVIASSQSKIPVNSAGVKGVRIGMDGKTPPTTSVVVDLEKALTYDIAPGADGKVVLTLHTQGGAQEVAKSTPAAPVKNAPVKAAAAPAKVAAAAPQAKPATVTTAVAKPADTKSASVKPVAAKAADAKTVPAKAAVAAPVVAKTQAPAAPAKGQPAAAKVDPKQQAKGAAPAKPLATTIAAVPALPEKPAEPAKPKQEEKHWAMSGKRDPFFSPVVQTNGSGCTTGKKCLEIGTINLRGVVKSDSGFIAVVTNSLNKAYFLRENDPVFNGYVVKITGDSVVFQETIQDKLGKPFTREVVKRIFTPAV